MTKESHAFWKRSLEAFESAEMDLQHSPNGSASRAYYSAYYAISAVFALQGVFFKTHDGVEIAVHRDLIKTGVFQRQFVEWFKTLRRARQVGDYGILEDIPPEEAKACVDAAKGILEAVYLLRSDEFTRPGWMTDTPAGSGE